MSDLHAACSLGDVEKVLELLRGEAKTSCVNVRMETPLHVVCALSRDRTEKKMEIVKQLLLHDAPLQEEDERGRTPLMLACETASVDVAAALLDNGSDLRAHYRGDGTMLHAAVAGGNARVLSPACSGQLDIMRLLLEAGADPNVAETKSGVTPLMRAVREGKEAAVQMLLSHGADVNAADSYGETSLYHVPCSGRLDIMRLLLEAGANPNVAKTESGETPLIKAVREGEEAVARMLLAGADANAADLYGQTSLHMAARSGQLDIMRLLLEAAAKPNVADTESGETLLIRATLYHAACFGRLDIVRLLLEAGADANAVDSYGRTTMYHAAFFGWLDIMRLLLEAGADPNAAFSYGQTTLYQAVRFGRRDIVRLLLEAGADANAADSYGVTSLHIAARSGQLDIVRLLLEDDEAAVLMLLSHGADANAADSHGETFLYHVPCSGRLDIMRLLLEAGADPNVAEAQTGKTPLMMAAW
ncbi:PREDICTED: putative ankyrin repeat protein RF_0381, partial [Priapulus caudatus]|uniref:Ankyrin repeat protein RF_0381 n=1 Tax=Priapulus caudatus TaxID=37621 RepID=A0ABM1EW11_PRICU